MAKKWVLWPREPVVKRGEAEGPQNLLFFEVPENNCFVV